MDTLTSINVFRQVVESGSFVGAAERLDLSTAMVSKHVMSIEKRLRVRLLNRNSHNLSLTEPGQLYFERCKGILQDLEQTERELESLSCAPCGTLRIACCNVFPCLGLAGVLAEYRRRWSEVVLDVCFVDRTVDFAKDSYDLAFRLVGDERLPADNVAIPFKMRFGSDVLSFISTTMIFGTPVDITLSELALETFFPADDLTAERMRTMQPN